MNAAERFRQLTCTREVRSNLGARSVRAGAMTAASGFTDFAVRIGSTAILARLILPEHFGLVMMATAVTAVADQLRDLGLSSATVQHPEIHHAEVSNLFWINVAVSSTMAAALCACAPLIGAYYHDARLVAIACMLAIPLVFGGLTVQHQALLTRQLKLGHTSAVRLGSSIVSTVLAIVLAANGAGYWALLWREIARAALLALGMWLCFPWVPGLPDRRTSVRPLIGFGANLTAANILATLVAGTDRFLLGRFWGAGPVAIYRQAYQLISAPTDQLLSPLYQVTQPCLSMLQSDDERYRRVFGKVVTIVCLVTMPLSLFVAVYAPEVTRVLLGERWVGSAPVLAILSLGTFMKQAAASTAFVPITRGDGAVYLRLTILQNVLLVGAMLIGVHWGVIGIALADVATTYLLIAPRLFYSFKASPITAAGFFMAIARPALASIAMALALLVIRAPFRDVPAAAALAIGTVAAAVLFIGISLLLPGGRAEWAGLFSDLRSGFGRRAAAPKPVEAAEVAVG